MIRHYYSARGHPLVHWDEGRPRSPDNAILTVENCCKWYGLHLVHPDGRVEEIPFPDEDALANESPYVDHVPNPAVVERFTERLGYHLDSQAIEMIRGRWEIEVKEDRNVSMR